MDEVCRHHIVQPFSDRGGILPGPGEGSEVSPDEKAYCTHLHSMHLPGSHEGARCCGDIAKCDIPKEKR
jgi:hypothetical protein